MFNASCEAFVEEPQCAIDCSAVSADHKGDVRNEILVLWINACGVMLHEAFGNTR